MTELLDEIHPGEILQEEFLNEFQLTESNYILMLHATLKRKELLLKRDPTDIWTNAFARKMLALWYTNTDTQFILDAYATASYCCSYMTKQDTTTTTYDNKTQFIHKIGNALLNYQQMSSHQVVHIALSLQLHRSSRKTMFIKTSPSERRFLMLKSSKLLAKEDDNSEDIMYASFIEKHISRPNTLENLSLAEYTAFYHNMSTNF